MIRLVLCKAMEKDLEALGSTGYREIQVPVPKSVNRCQQVAVSLSEGSDGQAPCNVVLPLTGPAEVVLVVSRVRGSW